MHADKLRTGKAGGKGQGKLHSGVWEALKFNTQSNINSISLNSGSRPREQHVLFASSTCAWCALCECVREREWM